MESNGDCYLSLWPILSYSPIGLGVGVRGGGGGIAWGGTQSGKGHQRWPDCHGAVAVAVKHC